MKKIYNLNISKQKLFFILNIVIILIFSLTIVYAALSTTLNINGNAEVSSASWDVYFDNIKLNRQSITTNVPIITDKTTVSFTTSLSKPGDFYEFTIDVVNDGSIDAMIDGVTKKTELTDNQKKYLNYIVEYQNGELINNNQLVSSNSFVRLKVRIEFRKDIGVSDLPGQVEVLNLSFSLKYVQSNDSNNNFAISNNGRIIRVVSGDYDTVGSEICIRQECFYVVSSIGNDVIMLSKYNLFVGGSYNGTTSTWKEYGEEATGMQDSSMIGYNPTLNKGYGTEYFSLDSYWKNDNNIYPKYIVDSRSNLYVFLFDYWNKLLDFGIYIDDVRLIKYEELVELGCTISNKTCTSSPYSWVYSTSYWTGSAYDKNYVYRIRLDGIFSNSGFTVNSNWGYGVRPVVVIPKTEF